MNLRAAFSLTLGLLLALTACGAAAEPEALRVEVLARHPHDPLAFTQGLVWNGSALFESTGFYRESTLREVDLTTGDVLRSHDLDDPIFAEGLTLLDGRLFQLSWQNQMAFVYDADTFATLDVHSYTGEGWGLCTDGTRLIMSNGSSSLQFRDPETFDVVSTLPVTVRGEPQANLNEMEFVDGFVFANIWQEDRILKIDPTTGIAVAEIDASGLLTPAEAEAADVLNGIAHLPESGHFLLTGKLWPWMFEVRFVPTDQEHGPALNGAMASPEVP
jgi:glutamine cyclotransferase